MVFSHDYPSRRGGCEASPSYYLYMKDLYESILDSDDIIKKNDKALKDLWVQDNLKGDFKLIKLKTGSYKVRGTLIFRGLKNQDFNSIPFRIAAMNGNIFVEDCPNLESLQGLFDTWKHDGSVKTKVDGNISITNCPKFNTLQGIPDYVNKLTIVNCTSLRSLEHAPRMCTDVVLMKNGKRWTEKQIKDKFACAVGIMCSMDEPDGEMITEALMEPHLLELYDFIRNKYKELKSNMRGEAPASINLLDYMSDKTRLSEIRPSDVQVFNNYRDKVKDIRSAISKTLGKNAGFLITKVDGKFEYIIAAGFGRDHKTLNLKQWAITGSRGNRAYYYGRHKQVDPNVWGITTIMDLAGTAQGQPSMTNRTFIIVNIKREEVNDRIKMRQARNELRNGMIKTAGDIAPRGYKKNDPHTVNSYERYLKGIVQDNLKKYREIIATHKIQDEAKEFDDVRKEVEKVITRFSKVAGLYGVGSSIDYSTKNKIDEIQNNIKNMLQELRSMYEYATNAVQGKSSAWYSIDEYRKQAFKYKDNVEIYIKGAKQLFDQIGI